MVNLAIVITIGSFRAHSDVPHIASWRPIMIKKVFGAAIALVAISSASSVASATALERTYQTCAFQEAPIACGLYEPGADPDTVNQCQLDYIEANCRGLPGDPWL